MADRILCFGEVLLRLSAPAYEPLLRQARLDVHVGGAEANVAVALAAFGHDAAVASVLPDNPLGHAARDALRRDGVDTRPLAFAPGRMGLYFHTTGAGHRPSEVLYDRAGSAFAVTPPERYGWPALLAGTRLLHLSGITPALGENTARAALDAARAARAAGTLVSFDGNFRAKLWAAWNGDPRGTLHALFSQADIAFADHRDIALVLGMSFDDIDDPVERFHRAAQAAFDAFPHLQRITCTQRIATRVDLHHLGASMAVRGSDLLQRAPLELGGIIDRIGGGDAFAAGVLHGLLSGMGDADSLAFGQACGALKHYLPGDAFTLGVDEVMALVNGERLDVRR
ncbi:MAG: sugar kinase [Thermomonas sp.]|uniref:sugar kinase n=1 Tax=Thermomonas sp. TaxID=1971895 RepID=UPI0039E2CE30